MEGKKSILNIRNISIAIIAVVVGFIIIFLMSGTNFQKEIDNHSNNMLTSIKKDDVKVIADGDTSIPVQESYILLYATDAKKSMQELLNKNQSINSYVFGQVYKLSDEASAKKEFEAMKLKYSVPIFQVGNYVWVRTQLFQSKEVNATYTFGVNETLKKITSAKTIQQNLASYAQFF